MNWKAIILMGLAFALTLGAMAATPLTQIESFLGVNQSGAYRDMRAMGVGWARFDMPMWTEGPTKSFDFSQTDAIFREMMAQGVQPLPILDYSIPWAAATEDYTFEYKGIHYLIDVERDAGKPFGYRYTRIGTDPKTGKEVSRTEVDPTRLSPRRDAWEQAVERVVARYSQPPYNVKYWQVWNEGTFESGAFWHENVERYVDNIHLPAAKIIRKYGGKVVWGGWPDCNTLAEYDAALKYHDAWKYTDIVDTHYLSPVAFQYLYDRWVRNGKCEGIWMTEIGFTQNQDIIANTYPRMFYWGLTHQFTDPDKYKVFWFAWGSPDDPKAYGYRCCLTNGAGLTPHGKQCNQLANLLHGQQVKAYTQFTTSPKMSFSLNEREASVEGFQCDERYIFALHIPITASTHWIDWKTGDSIHMGFAPGNRIELRLRNLGGQAFTARVLPLAGTGEPKAATVERRGKDLIVSAIPPISPGESCTQILSTERTFYVEVTPTTAP